jgi:hypothetical protein
VGRGLDAGGLAVEAAGVAVLPVLLHLPWAALFHGVVELRPPGPKIEQGHGHPAGSLYQVHRDYYLPGTGQGAQTAAASPPTPREW